MSANKFVLKHHQVEIEYTFGETLGIPVLSYRDGTTVKTFKVNEITTQDTALGSLVSIPLETSVDTGGERFGFFLPAVDVVRGQTEAFQTVGVYEKFSGPDSIPRSLPSWRCLELHGTAESVFVPLIEQSAAPS